ncbi:hypothetical protein M0R45_017077 [Rubus argutus]|uniref:non-specific serine/threonine protein kinase n=1 Tax=Rubus argutus TaxID=59490 RepID=A0AAW1XUK6_RUBAR
MDQLIIAMRMLYQKAKLVHADLSKFSILYFEGHLYIIDVSQAVDLNDPSANGFLCKDCLYVSGGQLSGYVHYKVVARGSISAEDELADSLFMQSFIARALEHVKNVEADAIWITCDKDAEDMYYNTITGLEQALSRVQVVHLKLNPTMVAMKKTQVIPDSSFGIKAHHPLEKKVAIKDFKKKVKEQKREARKHKAPKTVKKRKKKLSKPCKTR